MILTLLVGGPQDGKVAETTGAVPVILLGTPRLRSLLDEPEQEARWNEKAAWYEFRGTVGGWRKPE